MLSECDPYFLCGRGQLERAFSLLAEMQSRSDTKPNVVTYTSLIDACAKARQPRRAVAVFRQMIERGVAPNDITCHALFSGCLQQARATVPRPLTPTPSPQDLASSPPRSAPTLTLRHRPLCVSRERCCSRARCCNT